jgi:hypothetical protein
MATFWTETEIDLDVNEIYKCVGQQSWLLSAAGKQL